MSNAAFISADYEEFRPETLRGFQVTIRNSSDAEVASRSFNALEEADKFARKNADQVFYLSSVDNLSSDLKSQSRH